MVNKYCAVSGCNKESYPGCGISFHGLPSNTELRKKWIELIRGKVTNSSVICSLHFHPEDYRTEARKKLNPGVIPSIFPTVALIFGITGACRRQELHNITTKDVIDTHGEMLLVKIPNTRNKMPRTFVIQGTFYQIVKKYQALRSKNSKSDHFFQHYQKGKCTSQHIGINKFGAMPKEIAMYLGLPEASSYTGHSFRRTSATLLVDSGADFLTLKSRIGWQSDTAAKSYVEDSICNKEYISTKSAITMEMPPAEKSCTEPQPSSSCDNGYLTELSKTNEPLSSKHSPVSYEYILSSPNTRQTSMERPQSVDDDGGGSVSPVSEPEEYQVEMKVEVEAEWEEEKEMIMAADPLTQSCAVDSFRDPYHSPGKQLESHYLQPTTSTNAPVIKEEIVEDYKEMFLKLQKEVEALKADKESLLIENRNLAKEIHNLKQTKDNVETPAALKNIQSINKDNELLLELAKENQRFGEKINEYAEKIRNINSKYILEYSNTTNESTMNVDQHVSGELEKLETLTDKLRRLTEDNKNLISERDNLKDEVQNLRMKLENMSEENIALKRNVKLQRKKVERLRSQCGIHSGTIKSLLF